MKSNATYFESRLCRSGRLRAHDENVRRTQANGADPIIRVCGWGGTKSHFSSTFFYLPSSQRRNGAQFHRAKESVSLQRKDAGRLYSSHSHTYLHPVPSPKGSIIVWWVPYGEEETAKPTMLWGMNDTKTDSPYLYEAMVKLPHVSKPMPVTIIVSKKKRL